MFEVTSTPSPGEAQPDTPPVTEPYARTRQAHAACMVCGIGGPGSPTFGLRFTPDQEGGVQATFRTAGRYQGYEGILHGGVISTLLDAAMVHCLFARGVTAVTAEMTVRFLREVPVDCDVSVRAKLIDERHGIFQLAASLSQAGKRLAVAKGKFCRTAR